MLSGYRHSLDDPVTGQNVTDHMYDYPLDTQIREILAQAAQEADLLVDFVGMSPLSDQVPLTNLDDHETSTSNTSESGMQHLDIYTIYF